VKVKDLESREQVLASKEKQFKKAHEQMAQELETRLLTIQAQE